MSKSSLIECRVRAIADRLGRVELITRKRVGASLPAFVEQDYLVGVSDRLARFGIDRKEYRFQPGDILLLNPGQVVSCETLHIPNGGTTYRGIQIDPRLMQELYREIAPEREGVLCFAQPVLTGEHLAGFITRSHDALLNACDRRESEDTLRELLERLAQSERVLRYIPKARHERFAMRRVRQFLHSNYADRITLDQMAEVADLSSSRLSRVFHHETGVAPHAYLVQYRINRSKALLSSGVPPAQTAVETGFVDQAHLTRHFKRYTALTPGRYARLANRWAMPPNG